MATEYGTRLRMARKHAGMTQVQASSATGIPQSTISTAEREGNGSVDTHVYARTYKVDAHWLATGEGDMIPTGSLARAAIGLTSEVVFAPYQTASLNTVNLSSGINQIPVLDRKTSGMFESYLTGMAEPARTLPYHAATGTTFAYAVDDDVMEPDFRAGTIAYIETGTPPQHGDIVLVQDGSDAVLRKLVIDGGIQYLDTINQRLPMRQLTGQIIGWVSGEYRPRRTV